MPLELTRAPALAPALALCLIAAGCGTAVSTSNFKGEQHAVAQKVSDLQADASAGEEKKICANDLSSALVQRLGGTSACEAAVKSQLGEVDSTTLEVSSVQIAPGGTSAQAVVSSVYSGKKRNSTIALVKEGGGWRVSGL